jgi:hypothetical protein
MYCMESWDHVIPASLSVCKTPRLPHTKGGAYHHPPLKEALPRALIGSLVVAGDVIVGG